MCFISNVRHLRNGYTKLDQKENFGATNRDKGIAEKVVEEKNKCSDKYKQIIAALGIEEMYLQRKK